MRLAVAHIGHDGLQPTRRFCALKLATVVGRSRIEDAKIGGITPEILIFSGICELSPPYILLPTWRLG